MFNSALNSSSNMIMREKFNKRAEENKMLVLKIFLFRNLQSDLFCKSVRNCI